MARESRSLYAICPMDGIRVGEAKAFDLARVDADGEARPFRIVLLRPEPTRYLGYVNRCPHEGVWLNIGSGGFLDASGGRLRCGKHGATFAIDSGVCLAGPCEGAALEPLAVVAFAGDVCLGGVALVEEDDAGLPGEGPDATMEITIQPD